MAYCAFCDAELPADLRVGRETLCPHCDGHLHACIQCRFYEPTLHNQCLEPEADYVGDRQKANFCEFFQLPGTRATSTTGKAQPGRNDAVRGRPGKPAPDTRSSDARAKLEALFRKQPDEDGEE